MKMLKIKQEGMYHQHINMSLHCLYFPSARTYLISGTMYQVIVIILFGYHSSAAYLISFIMKTSFFIGQFFIYIIQMKDCNIHII